MEGGEAVPGQHPVGDDGRQHGPAAPRCDLHPVAVDDRQSLCIIGVDLDERPGIQFGEFLDLPGLGEGVPLVLHASGVQDEGVVVVRHLRGGHVRAREEAGAAVGGREGQPRTGSVLAHHRDPARPVVEIADGVPGLGRFRWARPLHRPFPQAVVGHAAQVVSGLRVRESGDLLEDLLGTRIVERVAETHLLRDPRDDLPVGQRLADGCDGLL